MKIGIAQIACIERGIDLNIEKHFQWLTDAKRKGCRYVVFPELSLTGYFPEQLSEYSEQSLQEVTEEFSNFAIKHQINFSVGTPIWYQKKIVIGAITFLQTGQIIHHHKKILFGDEQNYVISGVENPLFAVDGLKIQLCICSDLKSKRLFNNALQFADIYCVSALITLSGFNEDTSVLANYAAQGIPVIFANHVGSQGGLSAAGRSSFWDSHGQLRAEAGWQEMLMVVKHNIDDISP